MYYDCPKCNRRPFYFDARTNLWTCPWHDCLYTSPTKKEQTVGDNFRFLLTSTGKEHFKTVMTLAFHNAPGGKATIYGISEKYGLVLGWVDTPQKLEDGTELNKLPFPLDLDGAIEFVWSWLKTVDYGREPDHDGDNKAGFTVYNEDWGHVGHCFYAFVAIKHEWIMYGK